MPICMSPEPPFMSCLSLGCHSHPSPPPASQTSCLLLQEAFSNFLHRESDNLLLCLIFPHGILEGSYIVLPHLTSPLHFTDG